MNKLVKAILILIVLTGISACSGGGTSGTGGVVKEIRGVLEDQTGQGVANVKVTVQETGESTTTDDSGKFSVTTSADKKVSLDFQRDDFEDTYTIDNLPDDSRIVEVNLDLTDDFDVIEDDIVFFNMYDYDFCEDFPNDIECGGTVDHYCDIYPEDPDCDPYYDIIGTDEFCFEFPFEPECIEDDYCLDFPNDPFCSTGFEEDFCVEFPDDPVCSDADYCFDFPEDPFCDDLDYCAEFPEDPFCTDFTDDEFCFEFPEDPECFF